MLYSLLTLATLATPTAPQQSFPVITATDRAGMVQRLDEHGHAARAFVDQPGSPQISTVGGQQALGADNWMALGPFGGDVGDVAASATDAQVVLAGLAPSSGNGTLYRSTDGGATWSESSTLSGLSVYDLEAPSGTTFYAGTLDGVWRSTDNGVNWSNLPLGIGLNDQVFEITIDPNQPSTIWVGVADALGNQPNTLLKSSNSGGTWVNMTPPGGPYSFTGIAIDPNDSNKVVAAWRGGFGGGGVFVSANGGGSWVDRSAGLPGNPLNDAVHDGSRILLCGGQLFGSQNVGVYTSSNDGVAWT